MYNKVSALSVILVLLLGFLIQLTLLDHIGILDAKPDLLLSLVVFFALFFGPFTGFGAGFISGLMKDIFSNSLFGAHALTLALIGFTVGVLSAKFFKESKLTQAALVFVSAALSMTALFFLSSIVLKITHVGLNEYLLGLIIPTALYTSLVSLLIYPVLIGRYRLKEDREYL